MLDRVRRFSCCHMRNGHAHAREYECTGSSDNACEWSAQVRVRGRCMVMIMAMAEARVDSCACSMRTHVLCVFVQDGANGVPLQQLQLLNG